MARHARQHQTTRIEWAIGDPEQDARAFAQARGGIATQARLLGEVVWTAKVNGISTVFIHTDTGRKIGICTYRWCTRLAKDCGYHTGGRQERTAY